MIDQNQFVGNIDAVFEPEPVILLKKLGIAGVAVIAADGFISQFNQVAQLTFNLLGLFRPDVDLFRLAFRRMLYTASKTVAPIAIMEKIMVVKAILLWIFKTISP